MPRKSIDKTPKIAFRRVHAEQRHHSTTYTSRLLERWGAHGKKTIRPGVSLRRVHDLAPLRYGRKWPRAERRTSTFRWTQRWPTPSHPHHRRHTLSNYGVTPKRCIAPRSIACVSCVAMRLVATSSLLIVGGIFLTTRLVLVIPLLVAPN